MTDPRYRSARKELEGRFPGLGLTLFVFDLDEGGGGVAYYISNAERGDVVQMLRAWLQKEAAES